MKFIIGAALAALSVSAAAGVVSQFTAPNAGVFYFHDSRMGLCPEGLLLVEYAPPKGDVVPGCYLIDEDNDVVFRLVDGRMGYFPAARLEPPKQA